MTIIDDGLVPEDNPMFSGSYRLSSLRSAKPTLHLFRGSDRFDVDAIDEFFERVTGRRMSAEDRAYITADIARRKAEGAR